MFKTYDLFLVTLLAASLLLSSLPACAAPHQELAVRSFFLVCYDSARKLPAWTVYQLDPRRLRAHGLTKPSHFRQDAALRGPVARNADYAGSGYSRGHLVPAADAAWSLESLRATYLLSNAVPQRQSVNAGRLRQLESSIRKLAAGADAVFVFTGPIFASAEIEVIGAGNVAVPTHIFKVVLVLRRGARTTFAAIVPNQAAPAPLDDYSVSVDEVEANTGLDFFPGLTGAEERHLESTVRLFTYEAMPVHPSDAAPDRCFQRARSRRPGKRSSEFLAKPSNCPRLSSRRK